MQSRSIRFAVLLGRCIARERERLGLTQTELGKRAGVSQPILSQWESGRHLPESDRLDALLAALGLDAVTLVLRLTETAMTLGPVDVVAADLSHSRGRGVGNVTLLPAVKKDDGPPPKSKPKRKRRLQPR